MKIIEVKIGDFLGEKLLRPIRNKRDIILLLLDTMKEISWVVKRERAQTYS